MHNLQTCDVVRDPINDFRPLMGDSDFQTLVLRPTVQVVESKASCCERHKFLFVNNTSSSHVSEIFWYVSVLVQKIQNEDRGPSSQCSAECSQR
jgi:hypothetical protein